LLESFRHLAEALTVLRLWRRAPTITHELVRIVRTPKVTTETTTSNGFRR